VPFGEWPTTPTDASQDRLAGAAWRTVRPSSRQLPPRGVSPRAPAAYPPPRIARNIGQGGEGGSGDDQLMVVSGLGDSGNDTLSCFPQDSKLLPQRRRWRRRADRRHRPRPAFRSEGSRSHARRRSRRQAGRRPRQRPPHRWRWHARTRGRRWCRQGRRPREPVSWRETKEDSVDCGAGRRDRAVVDKADDVKRCERVTPSRDRAR
jgi:hypothetical protein